MARKKAEPKVDPPVQDVPEEEVSQDVTPVDRLGEFPLQQGHYFYTPVTSPSAHTGRLGRESEPVMALQRAVGATQTGLFDEATAQAVSAWKQQHGLDRSPVVDEATWEHLRWG